MRLLSTFILSFFLTFSAAADQEKHKFCQSVAGNVMTGAQLKGQMTPEVLEANLFEYGMQLMANGLHQFQMEQLVRAVFIGYHSTKEPDLLAERAYARCMAAKET